VLGAALNVGFTNGSQGKLTLAGGQVTVTNLNVGTSDYATGAVWVTGGQLTVTPAKTHIGIGLGEMTVSNGTWLAAARCSWGGQK